MPRTTETQETEGQGMSIGEIAAKIDDLHRKIDHLPDLTLFLTPEEQEIDKKLASRMARDFARLRVKSTQGILNDAKEVSAQCQARINYLESYLESQSIINDNEKQEHAEEMRQALDFLAKVAATGEIDQKTFASQSKEIFARYSASTAKIDGLTSEEVKACKDELDFAKGLLENVSEVQELAQESLDEYKQQTITPIENAKAMAQDLTKGAANAYEQKKDELLEQTSSVFKKTAAQLHTIAAGLKEHLDQTIESIGKTKSRVIEAFHSVGRYAGVANRVMLDVSMEYHTQKLALEQENLKVLYEERDRIQAEIEHRKNTKIRFRDPFTVIRHMIQTDSLSPLHTDLREIRREIVAAERIVEQELQATERKINAYMASYEKETVRTEQKKVSQPGLEERIQVMQVQDALEAAANLFASSRAGEQLVIGGAEITRDARSGKAIIAGEPADSEKISQLIEKVGARQIISEAHEAMERASERVTEQHKEVVAKRALREDLNL